MTDDRIPLADFIEGTGLHMSVERVSERPDITPDDWLKTARHWKCVLKSKKTRGRMEIYYSRGSAHTDPPTITEMLTSLADEGRSYANTNDAFAEYTFRKQDFEDRFKRWCEEMGYDSDSRGAERTFRCVERQYRKLRSFLGESAFETLLWKVECE